MLRYLLNFYYILLLNFNTMLILIIIEILLFHHISNRIESKKVGKSNLIPCNFILLSEFNIVYHQNLIYLNLHLFILVLHLHLSFFYTSVSPFFIFPSLPFSFRPSLFPYFLPSTLASSSSMF